MRQIPKIDPSKFRVKVWDDFQDNGSEGGTQLAVFDTFEEARDFARLKAIVNRAYINILLGNVLKDGEPMNNMTGYRVHGPQSYSSTEDPEVWRMPTLAQLYALRSSKAEQRRAASMQFIDIWLVELEVFGKRLVITGINDRFRIYEYNGKIFVLNMMGPTVTEVS